MWKLSQLNYYMTMTNKKPLTLALPQSLIHFTVYSGGRSTQMFY